MGCQRAPARVSREIGRPIAADFAEHRNVPGKNRNPVVGRLDNRQAIALVSRGGDQACGIAVEMGQRLVVRVLEPLQARLRPLERTQPIDDVLDDPALFADNAKLDIVPVRPEAFESVEDERVLFSRLQCSHHQERRLLAEIRAAVSEEPAIVGIEVKICAQRETGDGGVRLDSVLARISPQIVGDSFRNADREVGLQHHVGPAAVAGFCAGHEAVGVANGKQVVNRESNPHSGRAETAQVFGHMGDVRGIEIKPEKHVPVPDIGNVILQTADVHVEKPRDELARVAKAPLSRQ